MPKLMHLPKIRILPCTTALLSALLLACTGDTPEINSPGSQGNSPATAATVAANRVAGIVVTRRGAEPPWRHELPADWLG